jgi:acetyl-CoA C-acetyltransferase
MGHGQVTDLLIHDGLWDVYNDFHMGNAGELCAKEMNFTREAQDAFAVESYKRALSAQEKGLFDAEIVPVSVPQRRGEPVVVSEDEEPGRGRLDKFPKLRPAFTKDGTITAANASTINDGAAALILASAEAAERMGITPIAKWVSAAGHAQAPEWFTTAPIKAMVNALEKADMGAQDVDLYEINEAFSVVTMAAMEELKLDHDKVNVHGGAVSLGHPIGASGARLLVTLVHAMKAHDKQTGCTSLCIGGGEAVAVIVKR